MSKCLMRTGKMLPMEVVEYLYQRGRQVNREGQAVQVFKSQLCCGRLKIGAKSVCFASISGVEFEGLVESEFGVVQACFVIPGQELPEGKKGQLYDIGPDGQLTPCEEHWV